jgi:hypothetical protein
MSFELGGEWEQLRLEDGEGLAGSAAEADLADDAARIDDRGEPAVFLDLGEDREADRLLRAVRRGLRFRSG